MSNDDKKLTDLRNAAKALRLNARLLVEYTDKFADLMDKAKKFGDMGTQEEHLQAAKIGDVMAWLSKNINQVGGAATAGYAVKHSPGNPEAFIKELDEELGPVKKRLEAISNGQPDPVLVNAN